MLAPKFLQVPAVAEGPSAAVVSASAPSATKAPALADVLASMAGCCEATAAPAGDNAVPSGNGDGDGGPQGRGEDATAAAATVASAAATITANGPSRDIPLLPQQLQQQLPPRTT